MTKNARDRQILRALQGAHRQIRENDDATKASGARRQVQASLRDTNNTVKISWNCQTRMMMKQFLRRMIQRKKIKTEAISHSNTHVQTLRGKSVHRQYVILHGAHLQALERYTHQAHSICKSPTKVFMIENRVAQFLKS